MKTLYFNDEKEWLEARLCKITGTRLKDIASKKKVDVTFNDAISKKSDRKLGFYELIAERIGLPDDGEDPMSRGHRLQEEAIERFEEKTGKAVDQTLVVWTRDDDDRIAISPDGVIGDGIEAVEIKCLSTAKHLQAVIENRIPDDYEMQAIQYFIVNDKLETLYFCLYDPRLKVKDFHVIEIPRSLVLPDIERVSIFERTTLAEIDAIVDELLSI